MWYIEKGTFALYFKFTIIAVADFLVVHPSFRASHREVMHLMYQMPLQNRRRSCIPRRNEPWESEPGHGDFSLFANGLQEGLFFRMGHGDLTTLSDLRSLIQMFDIRPDVVTYINLRTMPICHLR